MRIGNFLLMAAAQVLLVRQTAQLFVFQLPLQFFHLCLQFFVSGCGGFGCGIFLFGRDVLFFFRCGVLFAHGFALFKVTEWIFHGRQYKAV